MKDSLSGIPLTVKKVINVLRQLGGLLREETTITTKEYYEARALRWERLERKGQRGVVRYYHENGSLWLELPFNEDTLEGLVKEYYENGTLKCESPYKKGKPEGVMKLYNDKGKLAALITRRNGELIESTGWMEI